MVSLAPHFSRWALLGLAILLSGLSLQAQVPQIINYEGRVAVGGMNFNGSGQFAFALVNTNGTTTYWSNDGTSTAGNQPTSAITLTVTNGLYSVLLGDATITNMTAVPYTVFGNSDVRLRIWFNDGTHGFQLLTPDERITSVGYALVANSVNGVSLSGTGTLNIGSGGTLGTAAFSSSANYVQTALLGSGVQSALSSAVNSINGFTTGTNVGLQPLAQTGPSRPNFVFIGDSRTAGAGADTTAHGFVSLLRGLGIDNNGNTDTASATNTTNTTPGLGNNNSKIWNLGMGSEITADGVAKYYGEPGVPVAVRWIDSTHGTITNNTTSANNGLSIEFTGMCTNGSPTITNIQTGNTNSPSSAIDLAIGQTIYSSSPGFPTAQVTAVTGIVPIANVFNTTATMSANYTGTTGTVAFYVSNLYQGAIVGAPTISPGATAIWSGTTVTLTSGSSSNPSGRLRTLYWGGNAQGGNHITFGVSSYSSGATTLNMTSATPGVVTGMILGGTGIVPGTIATVSGTTITLSTPTVAAATNATLDATFPVRDLRNQNEFYPDAYLGSAHQLSPAVTGNPAILIDSYGINDCYDASGYGVSPANTLASKNTLYGYAQADGYTVVGTTVMPVTTNAYFGFNDSGTTGNYNTMEQMIEADAYNATSNPSGWNYLFDVASLFPTTNNSTPTSQDSRWYADGIHPSNLGHSLIAQYMAAQFFSQGLLTQAGSFTPITPGLLPILNGNNTFSQTQYFNAPSSGGAGGTGQIIAAGNNLTVSAGSSSSAPATLNLSANSDPTTLNFQEGSSTEASIYHDGNLNIVNDYPGGYIILANKGASNYPFFSINPDGSFTLRSNAAPNILNMVGVGSGVDEIAFDCWTTYADDGDYKLTDTINGNLQLKITGNANAASSLFEIPNGTLQVDAGNAIVDGLGNGLQVKEGSNAKQGTATLGAGGTVIVNNTSVTANSRIFLTIQAPGGTMGTAYIASRLAGTSFTIASTNTLDRSVVAWEIFEPAP